MTTLPKEGFQILRAVFSAEEIDALRAEADRVAALAGSACVRHLRDKSGVFNGLAVSDRIRGLVGESLVPVRSIFFDKTAAENWPVMWHQDLTITVQEQVEVAGYGPWSCKDGAVHVQPPVELLQQMVTVRIHLDETSRANGALRVMPESSSLGRIASKELLSHVNADEVICECAPGDVLLMSPLILHASKRSELPSRRRIIHFEYAPVEALDDRLSWHESER